MFLRLIILFGLLVAPAFAQELPPPIQDPIATQTYTLTVIPGTQLDNIQQTGTAANLGDDSTLTGVSIGFDFYYYGNLYNTVNLSQNGFISFTSLANGCCSGQPLPNFTELNQFNQGYFNYTNTHNTIFAMWSDLISFTGNPYYQSFGDKFTVGWYDVEELGSYRQDCAFDLFGLPLFCNNVGPNKFDFEITLHSNNDIAIRYGNFDNPVNTGRPITSGIQGDQPGEFWQIYFGSDTNILENKTYVFNSSEIVPIAPIAPDCTLNPTDPTCIINDITDDFTEVAEEPTYLADEETGSDDGSDDGTEVVEEEEVLVANEEATEELLDADLEEMLAEETDEEDILLVEDAEDSGEPAVVATYRELTDEEKAQILADAISKDVLQNALAIASEVGSSNANAAGGPATESSTTTTTTTRSSNDQSSTAESTETVAATSAPTEQKDDGSSASDAGLDILETGRQLGQQALSEILTASEAASNDSSREAESIAAFSSEASGTNQSTDTISVTNLEDVTQQEMTVADSGAEAQTDMGQPVEFTTGETTSQIEQEAEMLAESFVRGPTVDTAETDEALAIVEASRATAEQSAFDDESSKDAEVTTAMVDPALAMANTFNQAPNAMSLEFLGIIKPIEEKSDAEVRAEQVVAANKEQQDAINANYMDADQSGIVSAIAVDADVSSYLTQRIPDVPFYRPEDIYRGVIIKDNARGAYFLEKGNTDTYKKMVDEQYK